MSNSGTSRSDRNRNSDDIHRQSSRPMNNSEEVVLAVDTNDLFENETISNENRSYRRSDNSRREQSSSKRSNESSSQYRSTRHSSPSNTHKRHYSSQRNSSPAAPPSSFSSSSRYSRSSRPTSSALKRSRSRSRSRSSHERPPHRTRTQPIEENSSTKKLPPSNESADLSTISEDESTKPIEQHQQRSTRPPKVESSSTPISNKTNDVRSNPNETIFETSQTGQDYDLSLFPNSILSASSTAPPATQPTTSNNLLEAIDLLTKYKTMQSIPSNDPLIIVCEKEILQLIQKKIELQKKETEINERSMKIRERELIELEKRFQPTTSIVETIPIEKDENSEKIPMETTNNENNSDESTRLTRKNGGKSRFSAPIDVEPTVTNSSDENNDRPTTCDPDNQTNESQPSISLIDAELKVISTNSCRKVEIQSGTNEKKNSSDDLRYTISKNRSKQIDTSDNETNGNRIISDDEQKITINQIIPSMKDEKSSISSTFDFHSQRSFPSTSEIVDEHSTHDKRRSQTRPTRRQQSYSNERSNFSTSQTSRYATNSKRYENEDLRSHLYETKTSKSSRTNYRNNH